MKPQTDRTRDTWTLRLIDSTGQEASRVKTLKCQLYQITFAITIPFGVFFFQAVDTLFEYFLANAGVLYNYKTEGLRI